MRHDPPKFRSRTLLALRFVLAAILFAGLSLAPRAASAFGTVSVANLSPAETSDGRWKLVMTINYGSMPHVNHIPMLFIFTPTVLYERALTDATGDRPILNRIPLSNQQSINESMDVGFADPSGKTFATTKFDFVIRRDRGFEAGEYKLEIKRADDGARLGNVMTLKLMGDNPIVDRRAIVFAGDKKKEKKADPAADKAADGEKKADAPAETSEAAPPPEPAATSETPVEGPPPEAPKQGGCGCRVASTHDNNEGLAALALGAALFLRNRRRRSICRS